MGGGHGVASTGRLCSHLELEAHGEVEGGGDEAAALGGPAAADASSSRPGSVVNDDVEDDLGKAEAAVGPLGDRSRAATSSPDGTPAPLGERDERDRVAGGGRADEQVLGAPDALDTALEVGRRGDLEIGLAGNRGDRAAAGEPANGDRELVGLGGGGHGRRFGELELDRLEQDALGARLGRDRWSSSASTSAPSAWVPRGGVLEVLAEMVGREVGESAEPHADPRHAGSALGRGERLQLADEIVGQMLLVHADTSSTTRSAAASTSGLSPLPNAKLAPSMP